MVPRSILSALKKQNPKNTSITRDVYNTQYKIRSEKKVGETPMQVLENLLTSKRYVYYTREEPDTNTIEDVFFCHPKYYDTWRVFPHILMIDAAYKTNMYKLPFVKIVGVTSTHKTFCVAHAFISKEREDNFEWVLNKLKDTLNRCMESWVIIKDRDLALMNACVKVFPNASKYLCRWHIDKNIAKHCKSSFTKDDWRKFKYAWVCLCESPTPEIYEYNYNLLYERLVEAKREKVLSYINKN